MKAAIFFLLLIGFTKAFSQQGGSDSLLQEFNQYQSGTLQEKLFVHTDKSFYVAGEIVWCKVYDVDASTHKPLDISKVSYVEIINEENKAILQAKISMQEGTGSGSFLLPFSISSGNYILRAYTAWMKNFSSEFFFEKRLTIVNTLKKPDWQNSGDTMAYDVQFFPEGGNMVDGLQSTVGFKAVNQYGQSIAFSGFVVNQNNDTLVRFHPYKFGMGTFSFTPAINNHYRAVIKTDGKAFTAPLPKIYEQGYVMKVTSPDQNHITVSVSGNIQSNQSSLYLFVHSQQSLQAVQVKETQNGKVEFTIDKGSLGEGISHLTIFNSARQPLCERLYFKQPKQKLSIAIGGNEQEYGTRKKIQLQLSTKDGTSLPIPANVSLSVFRLDSLQKEEPEDIFTYLWLNSEIRGGIESPDYYLTDTTAEAAEAADNLMLTQGWRRFAWEDVVQAKKPAFHFLPEYEGHIINGTITNTTSHLPAKNVLAYLSVPGEKFGFTTATSNDSGNIKFVVNRFYGAGEMIIQFPDTIENQYHITIANPFSQSPFYTHILPFHLSENSQHQLTEMSIGAQTQNAYLSNERQHFTISNEQDTTVFYGKPDKRYLLDDYTRFPTMEEVMREYVIDVRVRKRQDQYYYDVYNDPYKDFFKEDPLVLLDGVPVWNINKIISFNPLLVRQLDIMTRKYYLGNKTYDGIVSYTTYNGDTGGLELNPGSVQMEYEGLQLDREFYSPRYETAQQQESRIPDFRNVLYWSPDITTNKEGKQNIEFYSSDVEGRFAVVVQGVASNGLAGSAVINISVKK